MARELLIVCEGFKLIQRVDGSVTLQADVPGDGVGGRAIDIGAAHASAFLSFLGVASSAARTLSPPAILG